MNSPVKHEIITSFNGISDVSFKGYKVLVELYTDELFIKAPDSQSTGISYKFTSLQMLSIIKRDEKYLNIIDIKIENHDNTKPIESFVISHEDANKVVAKFKFFKEGINELRSKKTEFEEIKELKNVALVEFTKSKDVRNYNYGTLLLSHREINFISYNGKNFILHLDELDNYYYQAVILPTDILGYTRWISIHKVSELIKESNEMVTFLIDENQSRILEQLFEEHHAGYLDKKLKMIQAQWQSYNQRVNVLFEQYLTNQKVNEIASELVALNGQAILLSCNAYSELENLIEKTKSSGYGHLLLQNEDYAKVSPVVKKFWEEIFLPFVKKLSDYAGSQPEDISILAAWKLLKTVGLNYYDTIFNEKHPQFYKETATWDEYIADYGRITADDILAEHNLALFTYFLMKNCWQNYDSFAYYFLTVEKEINR